MPEAAGDAPPKKKKGDEEKGKKGDKEDKGKDKSKDAKGKDTKAAGKDVKEIKKEVSAKGAKGKKDEPPEIEDIPLTPSQIALEEAEYRAMERKKNLRKRHWPSVTKVPIKTRRWTPPGPPEKPPKVMIELPPLETRPWVPPWRRRRHARPKLPRMPPDAITQPLPYESKLNKNWHAFTQVDTNKMMLQGHLACNNKRYLGGLAGAQTGCIALVCRALLDDKTPAQLMKRDVDEVILTADRFYKQCIKGMKCYKGKPALQLNQLLPHFYFHDTKYTVLMNKVEEGILAKHPDNVSAGADLMAMMEKRVGQTYMYILTVGHTKHFLIWGNPPESPGNIRTVCYIFDPHMLDEFGVRNSVYGAGAFLRYPGVSSFVMDFLGNHCDLSSAKKTHPKPPIMLTQVDVVQKEPIFRWPGYNLDLRTLKTHCLSEWEALNINAMIDEKRYQGKWPLTSLSAESLAVSRKSSRWKVKDFYNKLPPGEKPPTLPIPPEKPPPLVTNDQLMQYKGEDFFLYCPRTDIHLYGRDDMIPLPKSETVLHSLVETAERSFPSQFQQLDVDRWILRGTRHFASYRYQTFKWFTGVACCVAALAMLRRHRARAWNEDTIDETFDIGWNLFRESLAVRRGPIRRLVLGELKDTFKIRDKEYKHKERGIAVWGRMQSKDPKVFDLCRGIETFFKESDSGILQIPGEIETTIFFEGGKWYMYHPWPADRYGMKVSLQGGGKGCLLAFSKISRMCEHFIDETKELKRKPFSIADVGVWDLGIRAEPVNNMKAVGPGKWIVRGSFHEGDERFPEEHRDKQATPTSIAAIAMASLVDPDEWTEADIDEILERGDVLYQKTIENLEKMGISLDVPARNAEENEGEEEEISSGVTGTLAAADVLPRFNISDYDCIETDVQDSIYSGQLSPEPGSGVLSLKDSLKALFKDYDAAVVTARGGSMAVWKNKDHYYFFDPHGCDENGLPSQEPLSAACLLRMKPNVQELADAIMGNLAPGNDDSFNISPVEIIPSKLNPELGAPEIAKEGLAFEWLNKKTATILMGPRGENTALGKAAKKCSVPREDLAGRTIALPVIAAFTAAAHAVPPPGMHQDHMFNFLEAGGEYYLNHVKTTGRKDITVEDLGEKFEMGANTFSIEVGESTRLPLRLPDKVAEGGEEEEEGGGDVGVEGEQEPKEVLKEMKELLFKMWYDTTKPNSISLLLGDYHQLGLWMAPGGKVVAFDPAPTLPKGLLTPHRIQKGDELRLQRIKDEKATEGEEEEAEPEAGEEAQPEPEPEFVPPESCPVLMVFASPGEFIDKLVMKGGLDPKQAIAPYWLYPVTVTNELTSVLKEKKPGAARTEEEAEDADEEDALVEALNDEAMGKYFERKSRTVASMRGAVSQNDQYFMDDPNRDNQDAAMAVMGIVVHHIEPYQYWKPALVDAILKYGDRLYTLSLPNASHPPRLKPTETVKEFHVTNFNVKTEVNGDVITGDYKAGDSGSLLNLKRGLKKFFDSEQFGVICAKNYCVGVWKAMDDKAFVYWDPHPVGPRGKLSPASAAGVVLYSTLDELADTFKINLDNLCRPGTNNYSIASVKVFWEFSQVPQAITPQGAVPDEGYEWKVLTAFVETARGRNILRGSRPIDLPKFSRESLIKSSASAVVAACMAMVRRPHLWTKKTVDEVMAVACPLFTKSLSELGYEFRPGEDILHPLQLAKKFTLGVNWIRYDLQEIFSGKLESKKGSAMSVKAALEKFFDKHTHGVLWAPPHAVAVWKVDGAPCYYMMEPHACGPTGFRTDADDDGAACVLTFTSPKLMAFQYLQNLEPITRYKRDYTLYALTATITPIPKYRSDPPLVRLPKDAPPGTQVVPATSKVDVYGVSRRADEEDRKHPPGDDTWVDVMRAAEEANKGDKKFRGQRNSNGWLVLMDGSQFLSASHSMSCRRYPYASRGNQALACSVMAVAMSAVEDVCRWCNTTLDQILDSGDQLYQDSYLHYKPKGTPILSILQVLRKFYTPGNCVCRVAVYKPRQYGFLDEDLKDKLREFFREERAGVFVAYGGEFAVALFKTPRGFYMFDPADRDRYGRAVQPQIQGRARACFSQYPSVSALAETLGANIGPPTKPMPEIPDEEEEKKTEPAAPAAPAVPGAAVAPPTEKKSLVRFEDKAGPPTGALKSEFAIFGMGVSSLRRVNKNEK